MKQYQCNVCAKIFGSFNDAALCHPDVNVLETDPLPTKQNFCNPVNGVHASWCTGHENDLDKCPKGGLHNWIELPEDDRYEFCGECGVRR